LLLRKNEPVRLFAISVDPPEASREFVRKIESDGKGAVQFQLLSDLGSRTIDAYGLRDPAYQGKSVYGIPRPAVFLIDGKGVVRWARIESDYRVRPSNSEIRSALDALE
jgi:peroxiredoxin